MNSWRGRLARPLDGLALSPLGERVARRPDALHREAGQVSGCPAWSRLRTRTGRRTGI
jgi:hypothetical protein